ncbi:MAG: HEAT repeat domain-containing protein [Nannocystaceae bacterium]
MGLASLLDPRALGTLLQLSRERDASVRVATCRALADLGDHRGGQRLRLLLRDGQASVRDAAFSALARLEVKLPLTVAEAGLLAEHEDVRRRGLDLLVKTYKQARDAERGKHRVSIADTVEIESPSGEDTVYRTSLRLLERALSDAGRSVRNEAFKAVLNLEVEGRGAGSLKFAQRSIHADIRREVLTEVQAQASEPWAWSLLLELFGDPDSGVRSDAFKFAMKRTKGIGQEPLSAALECRYPDLRIEATTILGKRKAEGIRALLTKAVADEDERVRRMAVDALLVNDDEALREVMHSRYVDVAVRAAAARARHGDADALQPLQAIITSEPPEVKELLRAWAGRVVLALKGLAELGAPAARKNVQALIDHKDVKIRAAASQALAWMARPGELGELHDSLQHSDKSVQREAAMGLAYCGHPGGASILFAGGRKSSTDLATLYAALALGTEAEDVFLAFLDVDDRKIRRRALLLLLLTELREDDGMPDRCLAALSSAHPRIRLSAAQALENFGSYDLFADYVTGLVNDRGDNKPPWTISRKVVETLGELIANGDSLGNPQLKVRAARLLELLDNERQEAFDHAWSVFEARYQQTLANNRSRAAKKATTGPGFDLGELRQIVFGAYAGLSRLPGGNLETRVRLTAIARLVATARADERVLEAVFSTLLLSLADSQASVRKQAFESLHSLGFASESLASEALATGQRDTGAQGLKLLATMEGQTSGLKIVEEVMLQNTDGLEYEAATLLVQLQEGDIRDPEKKALRRQELTIAVHRVALDARSEKLRMHAVKDLGSRYESEGSGPAISALEHALGSRFRKVRLAAAHSLAQHENSAAFEVLVDMLSSDSRSEQREAVASLQRLDDSRATNAMMNRLDNDPAGTADIARLLSAVGGFRQVADVDRLLRYFEGNDQKTKAPAWTALVMISGYDQRIEDPEDEGKGADDWESRQHPRHDDVLARLLTSGYRQGSDRLVMQLLPGARWSRSSAVDNALVPLTGHSKEDLRHAALATIGWRLRKRNGPPDPLLRALKSRDPQAQFLGAEGLALAGRSDGVNILLTSVDLMADLDLRSRAVHALGELGDTRALDTLLRLVNDEGHALQETAAEALGHMGHAAPERATKVFGILKKLAIGSGGIACQALTGLRHFDTREAWAIVRARAADDSWRVRERVARLLAHNDDPATHELFGERLRNESFMRVAKALAAGYRELAGDDSLDPDYVLVQSKHRNLEPNTLDRLCERGDAERLLEILPRIAHSDARDRLVASLLARTPLPLAAAAEMLTAPHPISAVTAAKILGYAGEGLEDAFRVKLEAALTKTMASWREHLELSNNRRKNALGDFTLPVRQMIWACGQLGIGGQQVVEASALGGDDKRGRNLRREAVLALTRGLGGDAGVAKLRSLVAGTDPELRAIAAGGLAHLAPADAGRAFADSLDDATSLARLATTQTHGQAGVRKTLETVAGDVHRQGVVLPHLISLSSITALKAVVGDDQRPDHARLGAIEALAKIASEAACDVLSTFGRDESQEDDLRKAAWRGVRRAKRQVARADKPRTSRWEVQL